MGTKNNLDARIKAYAEMSPRLTGGKNKQGHQQHRPGSNKK